MFKRLAPAAAAQMDEKRRKMIVTVLSLGAIVLMVVGYRGWDAAMLYEPPFWGRHVNNLLMVIAIYLTAVAGMKTAAARVIRHPQLTGLVLWSAAHLLIRGDWAAVTLFGGLAVWGGAHMLVENAQSEWVRPAPAPRAKEIRVIVGTVIVVAVIGGIHMLFGLRPFGA